ncbi:unnamed protein product, partial [Coccothraustes coccothraustes]
VAQAQIPALSLSPGGAASWGSSTLPSCGGRHLPSSVQGPGLPSSGRMAFPPPPSLRAGQGRSPLPLLPASPPLPFPPLPSPWSRLPRSPPPVLPSSRPRPLIPPLRNHPLASPGTHTPPCPRWARRFPPATHECGRSSRPSSPPRPRRPSAGVLYPSEHREDTLLCCETSLGQGPPQGTPRIFLEEWAPLPGHHVAAAQPQPQISPKFEEKGAGTTRENSPPARRTRWRTTRSTVGESGNEEEKL